MSFGRAIDKLRQASNILLLFLVVVVAAAFVIWALTPAERVGTTFWISMGSMAFALLLVALFAMRASFRGNAGRDVPGDFSQLFLVAMYFVFAVALSVANVYAQFSVMVYATIHVVGAALFSVPLLLSNMAMLKMSGADRREMARGRVSLSLKAGHIRDLAADLARSFDVPDEQLHPLKKLADSLQYSDPDPGPKDLELSLDRALGALDGALGSFTSGASGSPDALWRDVTDACAAAERALSARNAAVLAAK